MFELRCIGKADHAGGQALAGIELSKSPGNSRGSKKDCSTLIGARGPNMWKEDSFAEGGGGFWWEGSAEM